MTETVAVPLMGSVKASRQVELNRPGVEKTIFFYSFSGAILISEPLPILSAHANDKLVEIKVARIGAASFRPTPQLSFFNVGDFFKSEEMPPRFPLQMATFPSVNGKDAASFDVWFGPTDKAPPTGPQLPPDTLIVELAGPESPNHHKVMSEYFIDPLLDWLRVLSKQWWIGRSIEGTSGGIHFIVPTNEKNELVGSPTPLVQFASASSQMLPVSAEIWIKAAENGFGNKRPPAHDSLEMDASFMLASREYRSGIILACSAIEAARDELLDRAGKRISDMNTSSTDLLKHLSIGLEAVVGRNLQTEDDALFQILLAFWIARGEAAHGKAMFWRLSGQTERIQDVEFGTISDNLTKILHWIAAIKPTRE